MNLPSHEDVVSNKDFSTTVVFSSDIKLVDHAKKCINFAPCKEQDVLLYNDHMVILNLIILNIMQAMNAETKKKSRETGGMDPLERPMTSVVDS